MGQKVSKGEEQAATKRIKILPFCPPEKKGIIHISEDNTFRTSHCVGVCTLNSYNPPNAGITTHSLSRFKIVSLP